MLPLKVVIIVLDSSTLSVVLTDLLMITCVTLNALKLIFSAKLLAHQSKETVNVIKDTFLFVELITRLTEMNVY